MGGPEPVDALPVPGGEVSLEDRSLSAVPTRDWRRRAEEAAAEHRRILQQFTIWRACIESLAFPIRGRAGWYTLLLPGLAVVAGEFASLITSSDPRAIILGVVLGPTSAALAGTLCLAWLAEVARAAAQGPLEPPYWGGRGFIDELFLPGLKFLAHFLTVVAVPSLAVSALGKALSGHPTASLGSLIGDPTTWRSAGLLLVFYYPMSLAAYLAFERFPAGINPLVILRAVARAPVEYGLSVAFAAGLAGAALLAAALLEEMLAGQGYLLWPWLVYYALCAAVARVGFLAYRSRYRLGWAHQESHRPPEMATPPPLPAAGEGKEGDVDGGEIALTDQWLRFTCSCGRRLQLPFSALGGMTTCPECGKRLQVPGTLPEEPAE